MSTLGICGTVQNISSTYPHGTQGSIWLTDWCSLCAALHPYLGGYKGCWGEGWTWGGGVKDADGLSQSQTTLIVMMEMKRRRRMCAEMALAPQVGNYLLCRWSTWDILLPFSLVANTDAAIPPYLLVYRAMILTARRYGWNMANMAHGAIWTWGNRQ